MATCRGPESGPSPPLPPQLIRPPPLPPQLIRPPPQPPQLVRPPPPQPRRPRKSFGTSMVLYQDQPAAPGGWSADLSG